MQPLRSVLLAVSLLSCASVVSAQAPVAAPPPAADEAAPAQEPVPEPPGQEPASPPADPTAPPAVEPDPAATPADPEPSGDESGTGEAEPRTDLPRRREGLLPRLDVYFPEGDLDLRVSRLINKTFFEGQVKYNFVKGDITAFLRYRFYGYRMVSQIGVFDEIEFEDVEEFSSDFERVRGILALFQWPHSYHHRTFALVELDRISSNKEGVAEPLRLGDTNTFVRVGYQMGTPDDARSNAIVGETRARSERLFTAFRDFGPGDTGFTTALTYGFPFITGEFDYVKAEAEALKRFDLTDRVFLVGRVHAGSFLLKADRDIEDLPPLRPDEERDPRDLYAVPRSEFFRLDGRENLKGIGDDMNGTDEIHTTWELFFPWFTNAEKEFLRLTWQNWFWILYGGVGTIGYDPDVYTDFGSYIPDVGLGFESSFKLKKYRFFLSGILAQALKGDGGVEARISVKSYR